MSKNPVDEYFSEKTASQAPLPFGGGFFKSFGGTLRQGLNRGQMGESAAKGLLAAGGAALGAGAIAGATHGVQKAYDAATKARDFRSMLESNPDLAQAHGEDPKLVNQMFSTLRTFNPAFTRDPVVAGSYIRKMVSDPMHAGGVATDALQFRDKTKNQLGDQVARTVFRHAEKT